MNLKEYKNQFLNSNRNQTADLLKGLAVIFMIQVHLIELFARQDIFSSNIGSVLLFFGGPPAAPIFMAVMGYYIAQSKKTISTQSQAWRLTIRWWYFTQYWIKPSSSFTNLARE